MSAIEHLREHRPSVLQSVCCSVLQRVAACCSVLQSVAECCRELQSVAVCCSVLQRVAVCCSVSPAIERPAPFRKSQIYRHFT